VSGLAEVVGEDLADVPFVFDYENACHGHCRKSTSSVRVHLQGNPNAKPNPGGLGHQLKTKKIARKLAHA
jgi:hypothetical protein